MSLLFYNLFVFFYRFAIGIASLWNKKAKEWLDGRKHLYNNLQGKISFTDKVIWVHCSSAGEFEQGKPVIENLKQRFRNYKIVVSFFSPSGYKVSKNYASADVISYLPLDTASNARKFLDAVHPDLVVFVKYDFWYYHLKEICQRKVPLLLISAAFRKDQTFFKWYGSFYKKMLYFFNWIFVQNETSLLLLKQNSIDHCSLSGDTRFDRVAEIAARFSDIPFIGEFIGNEKCIVAGSTWQDDEKYLSSLANDHLKIIIAPHEIHPGHIKQIQELFPNSILYSQLKENFNLQSNVLIIDNVGMLSRLYKYATIGYIGGGFTKDGVHNVLEAAVYGKPVIYGNNYQKYPEAIELIQSGGAFSFSNETELKTIIGKLIADAMLLAETGNAASTYVQQNTGATEKIINYIQENRLLTN